MSSFRMGRSGGYEPLRAAGEFVCDCLADGDEISPRWGSQAVHERIVRCRDCRWFGEDTSDHEYRSGWWCSRLDFDTVEDGFCHLGDPR